MERRESERIIRKHTHEFCGAASDQVKGPMFPGALLNTNQVVRAHMFRHPNMFQRVRICSAPVSATVNM